MGRRWRTGATACQVDELAIGEHMSVTRDVIATISKGVCASLLCGHGFRRSAVHFWRDREGVNHAVNFQASAWGSTDAGSFTINLGVTTRALYEGFTGCSFPANAGTALWPISIRIGHLLPTGGDSWWNVDESSNAEVVGRDVVAALRDHALPFFERVSTRDQVRQWVRTAGPRQCVFPAQVPLILAVLAAEEGDLPEARLLLRGAIADSHGRPFEAIIRRVADRLSLGADV
jgi:hypothetical protein